MPHSDRNTRSNSADLTCIGRNDLKQMLEGVEKKIIEHFQLEMKTVFDKLSLLETKVNSFEDALTKMKTRHEIYDHELTNINKTLNDLTTNLPELIVNEVEQRIARSKNIILSGISESEQDDLKSRIEQDEQTVCEICTTLKIETSEIRKIQRVGKIRQGSSRLIKVCFADEVSRNLALRNGKSLNEHPNFRSVFVNRDRTPMQQSHYRNLREEWKSRRSKGENVVIYRDKVVLKDSMVQNRNAFFH